jgi:acyl-CoA hydrolase
MTLANHPFPTLTAEEAAELISHGATVAFSGFTPAGAAKEVPRAQAARAPRERARLLIDRCAHPAYRDYLHRYAREAGAGHIRHDLGRCFELHQNLLKHGTMLPELDVHRLGA